MNLENLRKYVDSSEPSVNKELRNGVKEPEGLFDELFEVTDIQQPLYRWLPEQFVQFNNGVYSDKGYLSCSKDVDMFISKLDGNSNKIACFQILLPDSFPIIDVNEKLSGHNDEKEIILPRNLKFVQTEEPIEFDKQNFNAFLELVDSISSTKELVEIDHISTIKFYKLKVMQMTIDDYINFNLPFFHITKQSNI